MKIIRSSGIFLLLFVFSGSLAAEKFTHKFVAGEKYNILSRVEEDVYINRQYSHSAKIINRIAVSVEDIAEDGSGLLFGTFSTSTKHESRESYIQDQYYESRYWQEPLGRFQISEEYFMPVVRHVPTFPDRDLVPGDRWSAPAEERHDFRESFGIENPYVIPMNVHYHYESAGEYAGIPVHKIRASYNIIYTPNRPGSWNIAWPVRITGYSDQLLYWDAERGRLLAYEERFRFVFELSNSVSIEFRGEASAELEVSTELDRDDLEKSLNEAVKDLPDVEIKKDERGVTISLENIQFYADSALLLPGEREKIDRIAALLKEYSKRHLLVSGHTALAGSQEARQKLSEERAATVAEILVSLGVRKPEDITVIGYGAERPIAENTTEAGMARNRRVEITILEN